MGAISSPPVITDDGDTSWLPQQGAMANPPPQDSGGYWWPQILKSMWSGATLPGDVVTGKADMNDPSQAASNLGRVMSMAGLVTGGAGMGEAPEGALRAGLSRLPHSNSLVLPDAPTAAQLAQFGRVEDVPLSQARATQNTMGGGYPGDLIEGYGDKPVAARRQDGEYLVFDGHHRAVSAINSGADTMPMHVIDARDYAPQFAGRAQAPPSMTPSWSESDDDLLRELIGPPK